MYNTGIFTVVLFILETFTNCIDSTAAISRITIKSLVDVNI